MLSIETIASIEGRKLLHSIFRELRFERQLSPLKILFITWKICTSELNVGNYTSQEITILHKIGFIRGTGIWLEEIINRFFFSSVLSLVYFGAALLILVIGLNRFTDFVPLEVLIFSVIFEASMLILMFITMFFSPKDDSYYVDVKDSDSTQDDLLLEIGEIGRDLASVVVQLEKMHDVFKDMINIQTNLVDSLREANKINMNLSNPNPDMIEYLKQTNDELQKFKNTFGEINVALEDIKNEKIDDVVKKHISGLLKDKL